MLVLSYFKSSWDPLESLLRTPSGPPNPWLRNRFTALNKTIRVKRLLILWSLISRLLMNVWPAHSQRVRHEVIVHVRLRPVWAHVPSAVYDCTGSYVWTCNLFRGQSNKQCYHAPLLVSMNPRQNTHSIWMYNSCLEGKTLLQHFWSTDWCLFESFKCYLSNCRADLEGGNVMAQH